MGSVQFSADNWLNQKGRRYGNKMHGLDDRICYNIIHKNIAEKKNGKVSKVNYTFTKGTTPIIPVRIRTPCRRRVVIRAHKVVRQLITCPVRTSAIPAYVGTAARRNGCSWGLGVGLGGWLSLGRCVVGPSTSTLINQYTMHEVNMSDCQGDYIRLSLGCIRLENVYTHRSI